LGCTRAGRLPNSGGVVRARRRRRRRREKYPAAVDGERPRGTREASRGAPRSIEGDEGAMSVLYE
jgi:hypothetical protein